MPIQPIQCRFADPPQRQMPIQMRIQLRENTFRDRIIYSKEEEIERIVERKMAKKYENKRKWCGGTRNEMKDETKWLCFD